MFWKKYDFVRALALSRSRRLPSSSTRLGARLQEGMKETEVFSDAVFGKGSADVDLRTIELRTMGRSSGLDLPFLMFEDCGPS